MQRHASIEVCQSGWALFAFIWGNSVALDVRSCSIGLKTARRLSHKDIVRYSTEVDNREPSRTGFFA